jgi:hypothetical protein
MGVAQEKASGSLLMRIVAVHVPGNPDKLQKVPQWQQQRTPYTTSEPATETPGSRSSIMAPTHPTQLNNLVPASAGRGSWQPATLFST